MARKAIRNSAIIAFVTKDPIVTVHAGLVKSDPAVTLSRTPFGPTADHMPVERYYIKAAVPWKRNPAKRPDKIKALNEAFAKNASSLAGTKGVAVGIISGTDWKGRPYTKSITAPKIAFEIAKKYGKNVDYVAEATMVRDIISQLAMARAGLAVLA